MTTVCGPALTLLFLFSGFGQVAAHQGKQDSTHPKAMTIVKVDSGKGAITVKFTDEKGKTQEKTFQLTEDVRILDETGRVSKIAVFESGDEALFVESEGKLREIRRAMHTGQATRVSDTVRTLIELAEADQSYVQDLQAAYDMLRKLDTGKNGKIDTAALKAEADQFAQERVKRAFARLDSNKDGKISKDEARGLIKEHFDRIDTNKDGLIDFQELLQAAKERREHATGSNQPTSHKQK